MERLTKRDGGGNARMDCGKCEIQYREGCCSTKLCKNALIDRLAAYEDAEERGLLVRLPCEVGWPVYILGYTNAWSDRFEIIPSIADRLSTIVRWMETGQIGKTVFTSYAEAKAALNKIYSDIYGTTGGAV